MSALLDQFRAAGIAFTVLPDGRLHATGPITDATRATIRGHKAAILAELAAANDSALPKATPEQAAELHELVAVILSDASNAERDEVVAVACADPEAALTSFRLLAADAMERKRREARFGSG